MPSEVRYLWLDVETTGLDPQHDLLLEVAAWPTRSADPFDLHAEDARSWVINHPGGRLGDRLSAVTWEMHSKNGLLPEVIKSKTTTDTVMCELLAMVGLRWDEIAGRGKTEHAWSLAGNSVHFDKAFLAVNARRFEKALRHRILDVSSVLLLARSLGCKIDKPEAAHRAMDDVISSVRQLMDATGALQASAETGAIWRERARQFDAEVAKLRATPAHGVHLAA